VVAAAEVRRLALALPHVENRSDGDRMALEVKGKGMAWTYLERVNPKTPRVPRPDVLAIRCRIETKELLIAAAPERFFDDDHYRGYPAVLVRLDAIAEDELTHLLQTAWRLVAPRALVRQVEGS
jgi:hypothetical protein